MLRGGAFCGASFLESLLRRLLSELLGFLRALHRFLPVAELALARRHDATAGRARTQPRGPAAAAKGVRAPRVSHGSHAMSLSGRRSRPASAIRQAPLPGPGAESDRLAERVRGCLKSVADLSQLSRRTVYPLLLGRRFALGVA